MNIVSVVKTIKTLIHWLKKASLKISLFSLILQQHYCNGLKEEKSKCQDTNSVNIIFTDERWFITAKKILFSLQFF